MFDRKKYMKQYNKQYYVNHTEQIKEQVKQYDKDNRKQVNVQKKKRRDSLRQFIQDYKLQRGCALCGYKKCAGALEFHHKGNDKKFDISSAIRNARSEVNIKKEIEKCIVVCANCHRELHEELRESDDE